MNYADKMLMESRLMNNLANWMLNHGEETYRNEQSNAYVGILIQEVVWRGKKYQIQTVDGMVCLIEKVKIVKKVFDDYEKVEFIQKCVDDVIKELSDALIDERHVNTSEIIRDYKSEAYEHGVDEKEFDRVYKFLMNEELNGANAYA